MKIEQWQKWKEFKEEKNIIGVYGECTKVQRVGERKKNEDEVCGIYIMHIIHMKAPTKPSRSMRVR